MNTTVTMGRAWDGLANGLQQSAALSTDGWTTAPKAGDIAVFYTGERATVRGFDGVTLNLDSVISVPDNCAIWIGDGL